MAKKKKTRQQKIIADLRKQLLKDNLSSQRLQEQSFDNSFEKKLDKDTITLNATKQNNQLVNFNYLIHDLKKTAILTSSVIVLQIILYILLTNRLLILPGLTY